MNLVLYLLITSPIFPLIALYQASNCTNTRPQYKAMVYLGCFIYFAGLLLGFMLLVRRTQSRRGDLRESNCIA